SMRERGAGAGRGLPSRTGVPAPPRRALPEVREGRAWCRLQLWRGPPFRSLLVARRVAERQEPAALEPPASVAQAVSTLTIAEAFIEVDENPVPPPRPPALSRKFICSFLDCSANYNKAWKLDAHLCKHTGEVRGAGVAAEGRGVQARGLRPFVCNYEGCGKAFVRDYHLSRHSLIHTGEKPFVCTASDCDQKFNTKSNLKKHFERKHENQQKQYVCDFEGCKKTFKKHQQLKIHQCQHTNESPFKCTHEGCGKDFATPSRLKRHRKVHEGYKCQKDCSFVAKTWTELLKHVREAHKEEIICEVCQKTFKRKDYLKQHMKTHATERTVYRCPREGCGRTYTTLFNLQSHILSFHEERRPYICEHAGCGKTFAMKQSLTRHVVVHDPDNKMKPKVKRAREKRSLASRLSGYIPPKKKQEKGSSLPTNRESLSHTGGQVLSTAA
ncbi:Transcription factor IIIA, partial [Galemys pyrenaicus]